MVKGLALGDGSSRSGWHQPGRGDTSSSKLHGRAGRDTLDESGAKVGTTATRTSRRAGATERDTVMVQLGVVGQHDLHRRVEPSRTHPQMPHGTGSSQDGGGDHGRATSRSAASQLARGRPARGRALGAKWGPERKTLIRRTAGDGGATRSGVIPDAGAMDARLLSVRGRGRS